MIQFLPTTLPTGANEARSPAAAGVPALVVGDTGSFLASLLEAGAIVGSPTAARVVEAGELVEQDAMAIASTISVQALSLPMGTEPIASPVEPKEPHGTGAPNELAPASASPQLERLGRQIAHYLMESGTKTDPAPVTQAPSSTLVLALTLEAAPRRLAARESENELDRTPVVSGPPETVEAAAEVIDQSLGGSFEGQSDRDAEKTSLGDDTTKREALSATTSEPQFGAPFRSTENTAPTRVEAEVISSNLRRLLAEVDEAYRTRPHHQPLRLQLEREDGTAMRLMITPGPGGRHQLTLTAAQPQVLAELRRALPEIHEAVEGLPIDVATIELLLDDKGPRGQQERGSG